MRDVQKKRKIKNKSATIRRHFGASFSLSNGTIKAKLCVCRLVAAKKELNWIEQKVVVSCANKQEQKKFPPFLWAKRSKPLKLEACSPLRKHDAHQHTNSITVDSISILRGIWQAPAQKRHPREDQWQKRVCRLRRDRCTDSAQISKPKNRA